MHSSMYINSENSHAFIYAFFKNNKTKKSKFYAFINAFSFKKKNNIKKAKITHAFKHAFSFKKIYKISRIHKCIFFKKKNKIKKTKRIHAFKDAFSFKKIHKVLSIHKYTPQNKRKSNFMYSNMHFHSNSKFKF